MSGADGRHRDQANEPTAFLPKVDQLEPTPTRPGPAGNWPTPELPGRPRATRPPTSPRAATGRGAA
ncbi:hypothetical protein JNW91_12730, partial [Micromonospora sp. STR1_7]